MRVIDLRTTTETIEIKLATGTLRIQANTPVNLVISDVIQMDKSPRVNQVATAGSDFLKIKRQVKV